jgi:hypothetical protein
MIRRKTDQELWDDVNGEHWKLICGWFIILILITLQQIFGR